jgi:hypothetical protein
LDPKGLVKGISEMPALRRAIDKACALSDTGSALAQADMRAHVNPKRMKTIAVVARALALRALCPSCGAPGFGLIEPYAAWPARIAARPRGGLAPNSTVARNADFRASSPKGRQRCAPKRCGVPFVVAEVLLSRAPLPLRLQLTFLGHFHQRDKVKIV